MKEMLELLSNYGVGLVIIMLYYTVDEVQNG